MSGVLSLILVLLGPVALVVVPQWVCRKSLAKKGLPESLEPARLKLLRLLLNSRITVSYRVNGERKIPLQEMVGDTVPEMSRNENKQRLEAYQRYLDGKLLLPVIYKIEPVIGVGLIFVLVNIIAAPGSGILAEISEIAYARAIGIIIAMVVCAVSGTAVLLSYLRIIDILSRVDTSGSAPAAQ